MPFYNRGGYQVPMTDFLKFSCALLNLRSRSGRPTNQTPPNNKPTGRNSVVAKTRLENVGLFLGD